MEYSKKNLMSCLGGVIHLITLFFHGRYDGNVFIRIWGPQDVLELRERHPGGVQQGKIMSLLWMCDTSYKPIFLWRKRWKCFHNDLSLPGWPRTPRTTSWWSTTRKTHVFIMDDTSYIPIFLWRTQWKCFHNYFMVPTPLKTYILIYNMPKTTKLTP